MVGTPPDITIWHHVAVTFDGSIAKTYINGNLTSTNTVTNAYHAGDKLSLGSYYGKSTWSTHYMQDVRIYDHCLSAAEVREISQGLVLHYKLDGFQGGLGNPNLYTGSRDFSGTWVNGNNWTVASEIYQGFTVKQRSATWGGLCQNVPCTQNDVFTVSFYGKVDNGGNIQSVHRSNLGNVTTGLTILGGNFSSGVIWVQNAEDGSQWKRYWATVKITGTDVTYLQWRIENSVSGKNCYICGMKLEKGSSATGWTPAASESIFNIIQDSSGYGHNGTTVTPQPLTSDTPRYLAAYTCNGNVSHRIYCNSTDCNFTDNFSFAVWCKANHTGTAAQYLFTVGRADAGGYGYGIYNNGDTNLNIRFGNAGYNVTIVKNEWTHITFTKTGNTIKIYKNGIIVSTNTFSGTLPTYSDGKGIGLGCFHYASGDIYPAYGALSDFRIYCTALSADDILSLYHTTAKVDNLGGLHTFEAIENLSNIIFKIDSARGAKVFQDGLSRYTQSQCQVTLTDEGYHIYRPPNLVYSSAGKVMWGGLKLVNQTSDTVSPYNANRDNVWGLQKTHTYLFAFHAKGQSSNSPSLNVQNNMGWDRIAGMGPNPTYISTSTIPANFNGEKDCYIIFTINDDIIKTATKTEGGYTTGEQYLSYRDLSLNYGYTDTGALGTDLYLTDFRLYDVTNYIGQIKKTGITNFSDYVERNGILQIRNKAELLTSNLIER